VEPGHRGSGAGTDLIDAVAERAASAGGGTLRWITAADNATAQSVYDRVASKTTWVTYERET
jgi:ribosomal protein S18 acetylase RimI-like enzyme